MSGTYPGAFNQGTYPGALADGVYDDCWAVASLWCAHYSDRTIKLPSVTRFREAAGNPDDPGVDGGTLPQIMRACRVLWPELGVVAHKSSEWAPIERALDAGGAVSLAVVSRYLPLNLRFGFAGAHQIGVVRDQGRYLVMNPLAPDGSALIECPKAWLVEAALRFGLGTIFAAVFPPPKEGSMLFNPAGGRVIGSLTLTRDTQLIRYDGARVPAKAGLVRNVYAVVQVEGRAMFLVTYDSAAHYVVNDDRAKFVEAPDPDKAVIADLRTKLDDALRKIAAASAALR